MSDILSLLFACKLFTDKKRSGWFKYFLGIKNIFDNFKNTIDVSLPILHL